MRIAIFAAVLAVFSAPVQAQSVSRSLVRAAGRLAEAPKYDGGATLNSCRQANSYSPAPARAQAAAKLPAFCRVALTIKPNERL